MEIILSGPVQPCGPFPKDELQNGHSFSEAYYHFIAKSGLKIDRYWLCYSEENDSVGYFLLKAQLVPMDLKSHGVQNDYPP